MLALCQNFVILTPYINIGPFCRKNGIKIEKIENCNDVEFSFLKKIKTISIILSKELWPVGWKYEIN